MENFTNAYTSMSGANITATFDNIHIGAIQGISYSVTREKTPVYTMGNANPRSFSRGKRGIAGSMIATVFDRSALYNIVHDKNHYYYAHAHEPFNVFDPRIQADVFSLYKDFRSTSNTAAGDVDVNAVPVPVVNADGSTTLPGTFNPTLPNEAGPGGVETNPGVFPADQSHGVSTVRIPAEYSDQIMPFDITLSSQNEYGHSAFMVIIGVEILNEGGGISVDDISNEEQTTFLARGKSPWIPWNGEKAAASGNATPGVSTIYPFSEISDSGRLGDFYSAANIPGAINRPVNP